MGSYTSQQQIEQIERDDAADRELCSWIAQQPRIIERAALLGQRPRGVRGPGVGVVTVGAPGRPPGCDPTSAAAAESAQPPKAQC
jgi:hypothetical protein